MCPACVQDMASDLVEKEQMDGPTLKSMSVVELHACGIPMGKAKKFVQVMQMKKEGANPQEGEKVAFTRRNSKQMPYDVSDDVTVDVNW